MFLKALFRFGPKKDYNQLCVISVGDAFCGPLNMLIFLWSYKVFFTKKMRLFALNLFLLPLMIIVASTFSELIQLSNQNGLIAWIVQAFLSFLFAKNLFIKDELLAPPTLIEVIVLEI